MRSGTPGNLLPRMSAANLCLTSDLSVARSRPEVHQSGRGVDRSPPRPIPPSRTCFGNPGSGDGDPHREPIESGRQPAVFERIPGARPHGKGSQEAWKRLTSTRTRWLNPEHAVSVRRVGCLPSLCRYQVGVRLIGEWARSAVLRTTVDDRDGRVV